MTDKAKHTPGPWEADVWRYENRGAILTICTEKDAIAQVCDLWCMDERAAERDANAALIAAAPDTAAERDRLRATVESLKAWMEQLRDLHKRREDKRTAWPMPGMDARYREVCAALTPSKPD